jgi:hypothetical protein
MRRAGYLSLTVGLALLLLAVLLFSPSGAGPGALDSEKVFMAELQSSLYHLDQAKQQWADEKHKSEQDIPTMEDLTPYLGDWKNRIGRLVKLGINYKFTPVLEMEPQSDVATLTRGLRFQRGYGRFTLKALAMAFKLAGLFPNPTARPGSATIISTSVNRSLLRCLWSPWEACWCLWCK